VRGGNRIRRIRAMAHNSGEDSALTSGVRCDETVADGMRTTHSSNPHTLLASGTELERPVSVELRGRLDMDPITIAEEYGEMGKADRAAACDTRPTQQPTPQAHPHPASLARTASTTRQPRSSNAVPALKPRQPAHSRDADEHSR